MSKLLQNSQDSYLKLLGNLYLRNDRYDRLKRNKLTSK